MDRSMKPPHEDDEIDGCDIDFAEAAIEDEEEQDLFVLFAEALDPATEKTVAEAEAEWQALKEAGALS